MACVNVNLPEFKALASKTMIAPTLLAAYVSTWQSKNKTDEFPTIAELFPQHKDTKVAFKGIQSTQDRSPGRLAELGITFTDENGLPCAKHGLSTSFSPGGSWEVIERFDGPSHSQGGIDIEIGSEGIKMSNKGSQVKAQFGLLIPNK